MLMLPVMVSTPVLNTNVPVPFLLNPCVPAITVFNVTVRLLTVIVGVVLGSVVDSVRTEGRPVTGEVPAFTIQSFEGVMSPKIKFPSV